MEDELKILFKSPGWELLAEFVSRRRRALAESLLGVAPDDSARIAETQGRVREVDYLAGSLKEDVLRWAKGKEGMVDD